MTGDYLASDPLCWKNADRQDEIVRLPFSTDGILPQKPPMRIVDTLVSLGERSAEVSVTVSDEMPFVSEDGIVDEVAYFEMLAQSIAALNAFRNMGKPGSSAGGYLVGAQDLEILGTARVGDTLNVSVFKESRFGKFGVIKGTVSRNDTVLARGEIKIWHDTRDVGGHANPPE
jgi:predicted hotdog family 3-hydroxylacyl-ACP dehydratase